MRTLVAVCGVLAIAGACSSGSKHVSAGPSTTRPGDDSSVTVSSTRAAKRVAAKHATKRKTSATATTGGSTSRSGTAATGTSSAGSTAGAAGVVVVPTTTGSGGTSSQYVVGPINTTTPTTVKPFDASKPIDLSGTPGVTPEEQARAEELLRDTMRDLPKYANPATAYAAGYRSIQDHIPGITADEHYVNWAYLDDGRILDSKYPESLVYEFPNGQPKLVAAMYILPLGSRFTDAPDVGGPLTQWHVHNNLCLVDDPSDPLAKIISGLVQVDQECPAGTQKASVPMLHVWIVSNPCGPFAALEGIGAGQVPDGETRLCDTLHSDAP
jgi:hypothetical protein